MTTFKLAFKNNTIPAVKIIATTQVSASISSLEFVRQRGAQKVVLVGCKLALGHTLAQE